MSISQGDPLFEIDREEAFRRLLHFSIRQIISEEDPIATHLSVQSCAQLSVDLGSHTGIEILGYQKLIRPERLKEWIRINNSTFNYLKHADRDPTAKLGVYNVLSLNRLQTLLNASNYGVLFGKQSAHANLYSVYFAATEPNARKLITLGDDVWRKFESDPLYQDLKFWREHFLSIPDVRAEFERDSDPAQYAPPQ